MRVRKPAVAGLFYPADGQELDRQVETLLADAAQAGNTETLRAPKAVIAPHAGYVYSGPVAASAYALVARGRQQIRRVLLLGPAHRYPFRGLALPNADTFASPLGGVPVDSGAAALARTLPHVSVLDQAHHGEHSLEVHLPFLQKVLERFTVLPLVVGDAEPEEVAALLRALWGGPETLVVVSSDLSHYLPDSEARAVDQVTARAIERLDAAAIDFHHACGRTPVCGLLLVAAELGLKARTVDLRNSGDTVGPRDHVVGYGAFAFHTPAGGAEALQE